MKFDNRFGVLVSKIKTEVGIICVYRDIDRFVATTNNKIPFCGKLCKTENQAVGCLVKAIKSFLARA
jgi:hypothetical protein